MTASRSGFAALVLLASMSDQARAQAPKPDRWSATGAYPGSQVAGNLSDYYGMTPNFANFGLSGTYPGFAGYGYPGYGPGPQFGAHYPATPTDKVPPPAAHKHSGQSKPGPTEEAGPA